METLKSNVKGFTLVEVLVSLALFTVGSLGLAMYLARDIQTSINTHVYPTVTVVANQTIEMLNEALRTNKSEFKNRLNKYAEQQAPLITDNIPIAKQMKVTLAENAGATDANGKSLLSTDISEWKGPYTVNFVVVYTGPNNSALQFPITFIFAS